MGEGERERERAIKKESEKSAHSAHVKGKTSILYKIHFFSGSESSASGYLYVHDVYICSLFIFIAHVT